VTWGAGGKTVQEGAALVVPDPTRWRILTPTTTRLDEARYMIEALSEKFPKRWPDAQESAMPRRTGSGGQEWCDRRGPW